GGGARFEGGPPIAADLVVVATGARPPAWLQAAALRDSVTLAPDGGLAVRSDLRSTSHPAVFAVGDCAGFVDQRVPRSGVHALRQGPVLAENLASSLAQAAVDGPHAGTASDSPAPRMAPREALPARYRARRWTLALLNRCDGSAIGSWGPFGFSGRWAWRWKDRIDRRFIARFRGMRSTGTAIDVVAIVPALNEERAIAACLAPLLAEGARVLVVDGGSRDATAAVARAAGARVLEAARGRASQMNAGAAAEPGAGVLVFVHADGVLPAGWRGELERALAGGRRWGRFDVRLDSSRPLLGLVGAMMNLRSRLTGICTGDQAIFVQREAWQRSGGYPSIPLMEDIELSRRLRDSEGPPAALRSRVVVSARRWESRGVLRTIAQMWLLRAMFFFGASAESLHRIYYGRSR
ncbi:MAG TPA: TIGR04283 family arsenosugar biosynthesis glycosyltransferase, partial [Quisquiliibacterium sp.]|nr:TIGR04283 family arsenosugar biosynthesis glycosyltransferase [Quisquiliibacterium sp.]